MNRNHRLAMLLLATGMTMGGLFCARAESIYTIALVTEANGQTTALPDRQELWQSPFGGYWVVSTIPFRLQVDNQAIFEWSNKRDKLLDQAEKSIGDADSKLIDKMMSNVSDKAPQAEETGGNTLSRKTTARVTLAVGPHTIRPFDIQFTIKEDGTPVASDPRIRIVAKEKRIEVICYPVSFRKFDEARTVAMPMRLSLNNYALLEGLDLLLAEARGKDDSNSASAPAAGQFYRLTLFLPATAPEKAYEANAVRFQIGNDGKVALQAGMETLAKCADGREIRYAGKAPAPASPEKENRLVGVHWRGTGKGVSISNMKSSVENQPEGSGFLTFPSAGAQKLRIDSLDLTLPATEAAWPHELLLWDGATETAWLVATPAMAFRPGAAFRCRVTRLAGKTLTLPKTVTAALESVAGGGPGGNLSLNAAENGVFSGTLPSTPGLWRLRVAGDNSGGPLAGQPLGLALIGETPTASASLFTVNNRALYRRGDAFDLLWFARRSANAAAADWPVRLRGMGLDAIVARIVIPAGGGTADASGRLAVDTAALAAGEYTAMVEADGVVAYPFRFRICQRERLSDYDIYSFSIHLTAATFFPGSPINSYVSTTPGGPGLKPFITDGDGSFDAAMASYAAAPFGPVREMFAQPNADELHWMARASAGVHTAPLFPQSHAMEDRNPKHTLPENLAIMRRRMALHLQNYADYPGLDGFDFGWLSSYTGNWEYAPRLDGWQAKSVEAAKDWAWKNTQAEWPKVVEKYAKLKPITKTLSDKWSKELADIPGLTEEQMRYESGLIGSWDLILPHSFEEWFADVQEIRPGMTGHNHLSSPGLAGGLKYWNWYGKTHRSSVDFSERYMSPFDCFRAPAILAMDNQEKQKTQIAIQTHNSRSEVLPAAFGAAGRGVDGFAFSDLSDTAPLDIEGIARVFERFGSWFTVLDPLPDVAIYYTKSKNGMFTALYDLARIRRPAMIVGPRDVEAGELSKYKVLLLINIGLDLPPDIMEAFRAFEAKGGVILKDDTCNKDVPGRSIGFGYEKGYVSGSWGGAQAGGEYEFTYVWSNFLLKEKLLNEAFAKTPQPPVTTPDTDVLISPLAGKDSILCFVIDQTVVPLEVTFPNEKSSRFRQQNVLPKIGELQVEKGWYVHNLLAGKAATVESTAKGQRVPLALTRAEGAIYLLTKREPKSMSIQAARTSSILARLTGGLADAEGKLLADPMPFEVTLKGPNGAVLFHKFAAIGPEQPFNVPVPAMSAGASPELVVRDLVLGTTATQTLDPAPPANLAIRVAPDLIGGEKKILAFLSQRKGPVTILLDEGQGQFRRAADQMAALLTKSGRDARVRTWDLLDVRPLPLRWVPWKEDLEVIDSLRDGKGFAWRINKDPWAPFAEKDGKAPKTDYSIPAAGYTETGPHLRYDADVVLFGMPENHRAVADLAPHLRRVPTANYPVPGSFFVHYLWSPFRAAYDALYVGCRDVAGAEAAVACLAALTPPVSTPQLKPEGKPAMLRGGAPTTLEDMETPLGGTTILNIDYSPSGKRMFVSTLSYGDWLFVLDMAGEIIAQRTPPPTQNFPNWYRWGRHVSPQSDTLVRIYSWDAVYMYDLSRGWISKSAKISRLEDTKAGKVFQSDGERLYALDMQNRLLWRYDDSALAPDLTVVRRVTPRTLSGNGQVLLVSGLSGKTENPSVFGLDSANGKVLWQRDGLLLDTGKVIPLEDRFIVVADDSSVSEIIAANGRAGGAMRALTGNPDVVMQLPGRDTLLIAENDHFDRNGPSSRVYLRSLKNGTDQDLKVPGRVSRVSLAQDKQSFVVTTRNRHLLRFGLDGNLLWDVETPTTGSMSVTPDNATVVLGGADGLVYLFNIADGKLRRAVDLNVANNVTAEKFAKQERMGTVPKDVARQLPLVPPEDSYLKTLDAKNVAFGPNLVPPETMRALLKPVDAAAPGAETVGYLGKLDEPVTLPSFRVTAGTTYLVELCNAQTLSTNDDSRLRLEIAVRGKRTAKHLPFVARLPVDSSLTRRRAAFRADADDDVTLSMRVILPDVPVPENAKTLAPYAKVVSSSTPVLLGDVVVSAMKFPGPNLLLDGGPGVNSKPVGSLICTLYPVKDSSSQTKEFELKCPNIALRLVNGIIAGQKTEWGKIEGSAKLGEIKVSYADAITRFRTPTAFSSIVIYEDATGPLLDDENKVRERTTMRYGVEVQKADGQWVRLGGVADNTQLVRIFPCPPGKLIGIRYIWAGRHDDVERNRTDGYVRTAQIEAYAADDVKAVGDLLNIKSDGPKMDDTLNIDL